MSRRFRPRRGAESPEGPWVFPFFGPHPRFFGPNKFWAGPKDGPPFGPPPGPCWGGPPFGDDPFGPGPGRRRQRRGDIKYALLELLAERQAGPTDERGGPGGNPWGRGPMHGGAPELPELRTRMQGLMAAVQQVAQHGSPAQLQAAMAQLDTTRRELYRILAEDGERAG